MSFDDKECRVAREFFTTQSKGMMDAAFPIALNFQYGSKRDECINGAVKGITKREYYAAMAMQGLCANPIPGQHHLPNVLAQEAVSCADELIKALEK